MFRLLANDDCNFLSQMDYDTRKLFRETSINAILATDMAKHFDFVGKFKARCASGIDGETTISLSLSLLKSHSQFYPTCEAAYDYAERKDRLILLQIMIKAADVSNPVKPWDIYTQWADRVMVLPIPITHFFL